MFIVMYFLGGCFHSHTILSISVTFFPDTIGRRNTTKPQIVKNLKRKEKKNLQIKSKIYMSFFWYLNDSKFRLFIGRMYDLYFVAHCIVLVHRFPSLFSRHKRSDKDHKAKDGGVKCKREEPMDNK